MKKLLAVLYAPLIAAFLFHCCSLVPLTGRRQLSLVSDAEMLSMSFAQYDQFLKENKLSTNTAQTNMVKGVGSRLQESEADGLGLIFMAMAGYNPNNAIGFWQRMSQNAGAKPPEFLSTHPSDESRIRKIKSDIPEAMKYYEK